MKVEISNRGTLHIERAGKMKEQRCLHASAEQHLSLHATAKCGDWCPAFREPQAGLLYTIIEGCCFRHVADNDNFKDHRGEE